VTARIFLSHSGDESALAEALQEAIDQDFLGMVKVFMSSDLESIEAGENWVSCVTKAVSEADMLLVLCSPQSIQRPWVNFEAGMAWSRELPIVPLCHGGLETRMLPMPLVLLQGVLVDDPRGLKRLYVKMARLLQGRLPPRDFGMLASRFSELQAAPLPAPSPSLTSAKETLGHGSIRRAIDRAALGWTMCFIGEDQSDKLAQLTEDLSEPFSNCGDGKRFASGFSYWGIGPTLAWARACTDPMYVVMKRSIETFSERWEACAGALAHGALHYVSLGIGTGQKDRTVLRWLLDRNPDCKFFPVDMSGEMLRVGIAECLKNTDIRRSRVLPIQIDFSTRNNAHAIRGVVTSVVGDHPVLYSLLGNTLANFDDDQDLLAIVAGILRPQDRLMLEVATTEQVSGEAAGRVATEYRKSESFLSFVTAALDHYTSLTVQRDWVGFEPRALEGALEVRIVYRNRGTEPLKTKVPTGRHIVVEPNETIRLYLTRKYAQSHIDAMAATAGCRIEAAYRPPFGRDGFSSMALMLAPCP
jgi:hypothetical protein